MPSLIQPSLPSHGKKKTITKKQKQYNNNNNNKKQTKQKKNKKKRRPESNLPCLSGASVSECIVSTVNAIRKPRSPVFASQ